jgi:hypothetical protein
VTTGCRAKRVAQKETAPISMYLKIGLLIAATILITNVSELVSKIATKTIVMLRIAVEESIYAG